MDSIRVRDQPNSDPLKPRGYTAFLGYSFLGYLSYGLVGVSAALVALASGRPGYAQPTSPDLGLDQDLIQTSPVLQRWVNDPPNLLDEILNKPAIPTRIQVGSSLQPSWSLGIQDLYVWNRVSLSSEYQQFWDRPANTQFTGALRYYVAPIGSRLNLAPQVGYRRLDRDGRTLSGTEVGALAVVTIAPKAADLTLDYRWLPANRGEGAATTLNVTAAYALSRSVRLAARYSWINSTLSKDLHVGIVLEWTP